MKSCTKRCSPASESSTGSSGQNIEILKDNMSVLLERQKLVERSVYESDKHTKCSITHRQFVHTLVLSLFGQGTLNIDDICEVCVPGTKYHSRFQIVDYLVAMRTRFQELHLQLNMNDADVILSEKKAAVICHLDNDSIHLFVVVQLDTITHSNNGKDKYRLSFTSDLLNIFTTIMTALERFDDEQEVTDIAHI